MTPERLAEILAKYAESQGHELNDDRSHVIELMTGLLINEGRFGYRSCPCRLAKGQPQADRDIVCPCAYKDADVREFGSCYCGLYVSHAWNEIAGKKPYVPERRPLDKRL